jgi:hypothetical protein
MNPRRLALLIDAVEDAASRPASRKILTTGDWEVWRYYYRIARAAWAAAAAERAARPADVWPAMPVTQGEAA